MYNDRQKKTTWYIKLRRKKARNKKQKNKNIVNGKNIDNKKEKNKCYCQYEVNWENVLTNSIGKGLFTGPNKALVNTLALLPIMLPYAFGHVFL